MLGRVKGWRLTKVDSLEELNGAVEFSGIHEHGAGFGSTRTTDKEHSIDDKGSTGVGGSWLGEDIADKVFSTP